MTRVSSRADARDPARRWESLREGYDPPRQPRLGPSLECWSTESENLDPVTHEVLRNKLWNLNVDHGEAIRRTSGSNIVIEGYDFNCAITLPEGDAAMLSPYSLLFAGYPDAAIKWTLEHRSGSVGIYDGDIFLQNDPWVGTNHQMDTGVFGPVFVAGKLFCWLFNCVHQREPGGTVPGGFTVNAVDVYSEPTFMPPVKISERGHARADVIDAWARRTRLPELITLEVRSQVAGFHVARARLLDVLDRYGPDAVRTTLTKVVEDTAATVGRRLAVLPDATWRDERYVAGATSEDPDLYRLVLSFEKSGDRLRVSNEGTDPAAGAFNSTRGIFRSCVVTGLFPTLAYDQNLCAAGVLRQLDFHYAENAITSAHHPAPVSTSLTSIATVNQSHGLGSKMLSAHPELRSHVFASSVPHTLTTNFLYGMAADGTAYADNFFDMIAGGTGAFAHADGIDYGGGCTAIAERFGSVERVEQAVPFLYLFRRHLAGSGGHGRFRGGATLGAAWTGHKVTEGYVTSAGLRKSVTMGMGVAGGFPATAGYQWHATDTTIRDEFECGRIPTDAASLRKLAPHGSYQSGRTDHRLGPSDIFELVPNAGAGWGDTLDRPPPLVARDVAEGNLSRTEATRHYGAATSGDPIEPEIISPEAARRERLAAARAPRAPHDQKALEHVPPLQGGALITETVRLVTSDSDGGPDGTIGAACASCDELLAAEVDHYRRGCRELDLPLEQISELFLSPEVELAAPLVFRRFLCPGCGRVLDGVVCRPDDSPFVDLEVPGSDARDAAEVAR